MPTKTVIAEPLRRALASIPDSCKYMGGVSRAKFYADILPKLETVHLGARHFVVVSSMDRLIATITNKPTVHQPSPETGPGGGCGGAILFEVEKEVAFRRDRGITQSRSHIGMGEAPLTSQVPQDRQSRRRKRRMGASEAFR